MFATIAKAHTDIPDPVAFAEEEAYLEAEARANPAPPAPNPPRNVFPGGDGTFTWDAAIGWVRVSP